MQLRYIHIPIKLKSDNFIKFSLHNYSPSGAGEQGHSPTFVLYLYSIALFCIIAILFLLKKIYATSVRAFSNSEFAHSFTETV